MTSFVSFSAALLNLVVSFTSILTFYKTPFLVMNEFYNDILRKAGYIRIDKERYAGIYQEL